MFVDNKQARPKATALAALAVLGASVLVGCGKQDAAAPSTAAGTGSAAASGPVKLDKVKAAWIYTGISADAGSTSAHERGKKEMLAAMPGKVLSTTVEKVAEGASAEGLIRTLATQGNQLIFATSPGYAEPMRKVAADFPNTRFEHLGGGPTASNLGVYDARFYEVAYLAGVVAGTMSKTHTIGFVGSLPGPDVLLDINAYTLGALSVDPKVKTKVVWVGSRNDPPKEGAAAQALIKGGADVLLQDTDSTAVLQAAAKSGKYAFGWASDMSAVAPKAHLGSAVANWAPIYKKEVQDRLDGVWKSQRIVWGVKEGVNDFVKISAKVPAETRAKIAQIKAAMIAGNFEVFAGPLASNDGTEKLAKDTRADPAWRDKVDFYVAGVEGTIPAAK